MHPKSIDQQGPHNFRLRMNNRSGMPKFSCLSPGPGGLLCVGASRSELFAQILPDSNPDAPGKPVDLNGAGLPVYIDCAFRHGSGPDLGRTVERYAYLVPTPPFPATKLTLGESCASGRSLVRRPMSP